VIVRYGDRWARRSSYGRGQIRNTVSIRERPVEADTREVAGHWEGDLVFGTRSSAVATLVDRATRYAMVVALPDGRKADAVARALIEQMGHRPDQCRTPGPGAPDPVGFVKCLGDEVIPRLAETPRPR
jgi:IS30 family transposase